MHITITQNDWVKFSLHTRRELRRYITEQFQATEDEGNETDSGYEAMYELNEQMLKTFMMGVSETTKNFLKCFTKNGKGSVDELLEATGYESLQDFRGVLGGITRRMRKLFSDPDAYIIDWEDNENDEKYEGNYYLKEGTRQALENYFKEQTKLVV
ncbi:hypothetical protein [Dethiosulfatarculus sandiegensis]|uniref:Uncharacterized protein n=1 Tax=Dethiosulfatarculus sandiegensis TaxID=1429043 RepID=A0A0D2JFJ0_9BACT|nr:hypothetical protein [Dethiosulfatarculus sandiegensis]KIX14471.1 hypothetical protein X474_10345 [Dethiosulfatarculus sandiegensis]